MGKVLIIAEKPSVAKDIAKVLGGFSAVENWQESATHVVSSGIGHLIEIFSPEADTGGKGLGSLPIIPKRFDLRPIEKTVSQWRTIKKLLARRDIDSVINACDAGREGEAIFRLMYEHAGSRLPVKRLWLQSMTPQAIRDGFQSLRDGREFDALGGAARCRSEADWLIGINGTRGVTELRQQQTGRYESSPVGRVQTPTLTLTVLRELERNNFVAKDYWEVHGTFGAKAGEYVGKWFRPGAPKGEDGAAADAEAGSKLWQVAQGEAILQKCRGVAPSSVTDVSKPKTTRAPALFDLTTLQREANTRYKFSAKKTLDLAQALYETHKVTSYPRTDSSALPEDYVEPAKEVLAAFNGSEFAQHAQRVLANNWVKPDKYIFDNTKISDHFAVIPTGVQPRNLSADEQKIYELIVRRFIAVFHPLAEFNVTTRITVVADESFKSQGTVLIKSGWLEVYGRSVGGSKDKSLCAVEPGEAVRAVGMELKALKTEPPSRYTEATLLAAMEHAGKGVDEADLRDAMKGKGLGTPATRAAIIEGLLWDKNGKGGYKEPYITREGKEQHLVPTKKGMDLVKFLLDNGMEMLTSARMTGEWEYKLSLIEHRKFTREQFMAEIETTTRSILDSIKAKSRSTPAPEGASQEPLGVPCPKCQAAVMTQAFDYKCTACDFRVPRVLLDRPMSQQEAETLMRDKVLPSMDGFISKKTNKAFSAGLRLDENFKAGWDYGEAGGAGAPQGAALTVSCPRCKSGAIRDKGRTFSCEKGDFTLWKDIAGHDLTAAEAERLIKERSHPPIDGLKGKSGHFSAGLKLASVDASGKAKVDFVWPDRG